MSEILTVPAHWKYPQKNWFKTSHRSDCSRTSDTRALLCTTQIGRCRRCSLSLPPSPGTDNSLFMAYIWYCRIWTNHLCKISTITFTWTILYTTHSENSCKVNILQIQNISDGCHFEEGPLDTGSKWGRWPWQRDKIKECQISFCSTISLLICFLLFIWKWKQSKMGFDTSFSNHWPPFKVA